ncbi:radical SAM family heme chaperone HemW [Paraferrimonas haliotis]|uniref:Heme chaperone HemW n=1 Tax=Paraferrimonas haliotis TaxID=2013866 RepID=A0AA37WYX8_9GAMM|nr:radical SAM family heme chaperone HemW [Paraferrimonas haliotis]GLS83631.1 YggW family oxidoreductase [Paraferrimonas haliotis]
MQLPELSVYVHIPWCVRKCPYCDFNSHAPKAALPEQAYVEALIKDLNADAHWAQGRKVSTIFIGGGTPSLFKASSIAQIIKAIDAAIGLEPNCEVTMEANPGTVEHEAFSAYRQAGVNRLSLGIQTFADEQLTILGRIHNSANAKSAAKQAMAAGFDSVNLDLMHGLPQQTPEQAMADIEIAASLNTTHLSWYQLTIEPNTLFHSRPPQLPQDEALWTIFDQGTQRMNQLGFRQYEVSAWAQDGYQCRHNLNYWRFGDYLGIGCGAHGKITFPEQNRIVRAEKIKHPKGYMEAIDVRRQLVDIEPQERPLEYLMNRARLHQAIPKSEYQEVTGLRPLDLTHKLQPAIERNLVIDTDNDWQLTEKGQLFVNDVLELLVPED